uniref:2-iminobutanoate/2-iminopropanoate deaminase n=2 Tax=Haemonchus contortus TaxID=6289 RepID=A0A7I4YB48_HAECO|nr:Endoribonuclease L-PSP domain containing protein [Haemonchus contortus]CDJ94089.1 Endoribonuclease L-PSP domain containing protein [Haemonchus contortus]
MSLTVISLIVYVSIFSVLIGDSRCVEMKRSLERMAQVTRQIIHSANAPGAVGPYSQAVRVDNTIYISGSLGLDPKSGDLKQGIKEQTHQSLKNIGEILKAAGVGYGNVVKTTVLLADINDFTTVNDIYKEYFTAKFPARAAYQVAALPKKALVEIEAIAVTGEIKDI